MIRVLWFGSYLVASVLAPAVLAANFPVNSGIYLGLSGGLDRVDNRMINGANALCNHRAPGTYLPNLEAKKTVGLIGRALVGYDVNRYYAFESGFSYFVNKPYYYSDQAGASFLNQSIVAVDVLGKGKLPVVKFVDLYAKLGASYLMRRGANDIATGNSDTCGNLKVAFGAGMDYRLTPNIVASLEWLRFTGNEIINDPDAQATVDTVLLGLRYNFNAFNETVSSSASTNTLTTTGVYAGLQGGVDLANWYRYNSWISLYRADGAQYSDIVAKQNNGIIGRVFIGYDVNRYFAVESGYSYFFNKPYFSSSNLGDTDKINTTAIDLYGKGKLPLIQNLDLYAKLGASCVMRHSNILATSRRFGGNANAFNVAYGAGMDYYITANIITNIEWSCLNGSSKMVNEKYQPSTDVFLAGLRYRFDL